MLKKDGKLIKKGAQLLYNMIHFTHIRVGTNNDTYIYSSINVDLSQDQQQLFLNPRAEDLNARDLLLDTVGKGSKKKTAKRNVDILVKIKAWSGIFNNK